MREWKQPTAFTDQGFAVNYGQTVDLYHRWSSKSSVALVRHGVPALFKRNLCFTVARSCRIKMDVRVWMMVALDAPGLCHTSNPLHVTAAIRPVCPNMLSNDPQQRRESESLFWTEQNNSQPNSLGYWSLRTTSGLLRGAICKKLRHS
jgi:hypothetical protein|eukprot:COSAG02_NODE_1861_length_10613_cov_3.797033_3_plen_148_part_00